MTLTEDIAKHATEIKTILNEQMGFFFSLLLLSLMFLLPNQSPRELNMFLGEWYILTSQILWFYAWACMIASWTNIFMNGFDKNEFVNPFIPRLRTIKLALMLWVAFTALKLIGTMFRGAVDMNNIYLAVYTNQILCAIAYTVFVFLLFRGAFKFIAVGENKKISFIESFKATQNTEATIILSAAYVALPYIIIYAIYPFAFSIIGELMPEIKEGLAGKITWHLLLAPRELFLEPLINTILLLSFLISYRDITAASDNDEYETPPSPAPDSSNNEEQHISLIENSNSTPQINSEFFKL